MGSFGDRLKKEREQRGITLDDISLTTKIGTRLLRALEEEKFEQLPGGIFNKGFVRAYARHVGLDEDQTVADYMTAVTANQTQPVQSEEAFPVQVLQERKAPPPVPDRRARPTALAGGRETAAEIPWGILAVVLLVIAIALASWSYLHRPVEPEKSRATAPPATQAAPAPNSTTDSTTNRAPTPAAPTKTEPPSNANPTPQNTGAPQNTAAPQNNNSAPATPIPTTEQMQSKRSPVSPAGLQTSISGQNVAPRPGMFAVRLKGNDDSEECWVSISADGQPPVEATLIAPYERTVQAKNEVVVKVGSAGALDVYFNNNKLPSQGDYGTVKTLVFHPNGLQPAPQPATTSPQ
jgi:cytoskeleton protein RodZ